MRSGGGIRDEAGFTLVEQLLTMVLLVVILGATLSVFNVFERNAKRNQDQNAAQEEARAGIDRIARDLRNHSTPTNDLPVAIEKAETSDIVLLTVGARKAAGSTNARNLERVRYCLDAATGVVWRQRQSYPGTVPVPSNLSTSSCPAGDWQEKSAVAQSVVNGERPIFAYAPAEAVDTTQVRTVGIALFVDADAAVAPRETRLSTTVALRNQNRRPTAGFEGTALGMRHVLLVASPSHDPEGQALFYRWFDGSTEIAGCTGMICEYKAPATGVRAFSLRVTDPSDLEATAGPKNVNVR